MEVLISIQQPVTQWQIPADGVEALRRRFPHIRFHHATTPGERAAGLARCDAAYTWILNAEELAQAPKLRWVHTSAVAVETLCLPELFARGVAVSNTRGVQAVPIAEHINLLTAWSYILFGVHFVLSGTMRANGAVVVPTIILVIALFPVRLGIAFGLTPIFGIDALWLSWPAGAAAAMLLGIVYYLSGSWRRARISEPVDPTEAESIVVAEADHTAQLQPGSLR